MRLIDADALLKTYKGWIPQLCSNADEGDKRGVETCIAVLEDAPTIEAEPVKRGEWEPSPHLFGYVRCSECHDCNVWGEWIDGKKWNFCPNCGAKMDGGKDA